MPNPSTKQISLEKGQIPWEMETEKSRAPIQRRQGLPGTLVPRHTTAEDEDNTKEMISAENTKIRTFYGLEGEREVRENFPSQTRLTHWWEGQDILVLRTPGATGRKATYPLLFFTEDKLRNPRRPTTWILERTRRSIPVGNRGDLEAGQELA